MTGEPKDLAEQVRALSERLRRFHDSGSSLEKSGVMRAVADELDALLASPQPADAAQPDPPAPTWRPIESEDLAAKMRTLSRTARKRASFRAGPEAWAAKAEANLICDELDALSASTSMPVVQSLLDAIIAADAAINPPDRGGISMQNWDARLKAATTIIRAAKETAWKALGIWKPANPPPSSPSPAETGEPSPPAPKDPAVPSPGQEQP